MDIYHSNFDLMAKIHYQEDVEGKNKWREANSIKIIELNHHVVKCISVYLLHSQKKEILFFLPEKKKSIDLLPPFHTICHKTPVYILDPNDALS